MVTDFGFAHRNWNAIKKYFPRHCPERYLTLSKIDQILQPMPVTR